jgi:hypothetical protein
MHSADNRYKAARLGTTQTEYEYQSLSFEASHCNRGVLHLNLMKLGSGSKLPDQARVKPTLITLG